MEIGEGPGNDGICADSGLGLSKTPQGHLLLQHGSEEPPRKASGIGRTVFVVELHNDFLCASSVETKIRMTFCLGIVTNNVIN